MGFKKAFEPVVVEAFLLPTVDSRMFSVKEKIKVKVKTNLMASSNSIAYIDKRAAHDVFPLSAFT